MPHDDNATPRVSPLAGKPMPVHLLVDVPDLITAYYSRHPDPAVPSQRVAFGTSGHRGSSQNNAFNEDHILAVTQAICQYRQENGISGPLFLGRDTHALSTPAFVTTLEVLAANGVTAMIAGKEVYTPTPVISHAILTHNQDKSRARADGIVITPSHNPPQDGGFKYNPPHGGPAGGDITGWIENCANALLQDGLKGVRRMPYERALKADTTHIFDYLDHYVSELDQVIDMACISAAGVRMAVDPLGGAAVHYWGEIGERYGLDLTVLNDVVDPTFRFMRVDWDGQIRMDPSSPYVMQGLVSARDRFDVAFGCDTDHDRHGVVTRSGGLMAPNHYLATSIDYLFRHRPQWPSDAAVGKTVVSSALIDRVTARLGRKLYETPVGFKWFVDGLMDGSLGFVGEESAGATFLRRDGRVWTTDKDGLVPCLLSAEMTARTGQDPGQCYEALTQELGAPVYERVDAPASPEQKKRLGSLSPDQVHLETLAGFPVEQVLTHAPGNGAPIGGLKVMTANGWFAARPSGTEDIYKIYAESFEGAEHLRVILDEARAVVGTAVGEPSSRS
ncbi:phosphoglucomutase (alpha-D-glucose-1,6-bisphosphate-dependent) [Mangrovitalea sediminis]|uniref:phosphoglucomutase (alpha-D-glucose-1,6-bisphosphate-dependent) n=1 Tax=Mangrovitalea sediminis TaxID=1982043 RepID=UPI000BE52D7C|nr:phosphoglucomutase (alpha-D-glucose-1,6-bisphosphate-dependent) [Mangrovitalea sediminis]